MHSGGVAWATYDALNSDSVTCGQDFDRHLASEARITRAVHRDFDRSHIQMYDAGSI